MKIIYIEANAEELEVRPTITNAIERLVSNFNFALGASSCSDDEAEEEEEERKES